MREQSLAEQHLDRHRKQAAKAFAGHVITKRSEGRWLLQAMHQDGKPDWTMAAEVIALESPSLFVGGNIDHVVFAYGPKDPVARVYWMGEHRDLGYYVRQKARIGTARHQETVDEWHSEVAASELRSYLAEAKEEEPDIEESEDFDADYFEMALHAETRQSFYDYACKAFKNERDIWESVGSMGEVLSAAVIYAHAALARLSVLLREEESREAVEVSRG